MVWFAQTILKGLRIVNEICYLHPKDVQDNKIKATNNDVIANLPYVEGCGMWFDHHSSEVERLKLKGKFVGAIEPFDSAARVVFNFFRARKPYSQIVQKFEELVKIADIVDSAKFTKTDIMNPQGMDNAGVLFLILALTLAKNIHLESAICNY